MDKHKELTPEELALKQQREEMWRINEEKLLQKQMKNDKEKIQNGFYATEMEKKNHALSVAFKQIKDLEFQIEDLKYQLRCHYETIERLENDKSMHEKELETKKFSTASWFSLGKYALTVFFMMYVLDCVIQIGKGYFTMKVTREMGVKKLDVTQDLGTKGIEVLHKAADWFSKE